MFSHKASGKKITLLLLCFCLGVLITALLTRLMPTLNGTPIKAQIIEHETIGPTENQHQISTVNLLDIQLPLPPAKPVFKTPNPNLAIKESETVKPVPIPKPSVNTDQVQIQIIGLALLKKIDQKNSPDIQISLPKNTNHQIQVVQVLRQCLGVTLGKLSATGKVLAREQHRAPVSPYIRLVEGRLTLQEQSIVNRWRKLPGSIVRFYPEVADARVLGGLHQLMNGAIENKTITGEYRVQGGELILTNITINAKANSTEIVIAKTCQR